MKHHQHIAELGPLLECFSIRHVVICPGSRNAPLIQLFTSNPAFHCYSIVDERSAAYLALGMARQLKEPVGILTTSGTAVLNLAPGVAEAYSQEIPLLVMTADRPLEKIGQFNNQWLDQQAPFYTFSKGFYQLPLAVNHEEDLTRVIKDTGRLLRAALSAPAGPVHLNIPLEEPLYELLPSAQNTHIYPLNLTEEGDKLEKPEAPGPQTKIMILAGMGAYDEALDVRLSSMVESSQAVVIAENIANLPGKEFINHPDLILAGTGEEIRNSLKPDLVISFGGQVVSKRLKIFLQAIPDLAHQEIRGDVSGWLDLMMNQFSLSGRSAEPNLFMEAWKREEKRTLELVGNDFDSLDFGSLWVIQALLDAVPSGTVIHLGNSSTIRYSQMLPCRKDLGYFSNRGISGIDGCVSAAVGAAMVSEGLHLLLVGDLSFVYDSNALWNRQFPDNLKIVVLNDEGGGIFRLLKGPSDMDFFEEFSVTHHPVSPRLLAQSFGRKAKSVQNKHEAKEAIVELLADESSISVLEVNISGGENSRIFKEFIDLKQ